MSEIIWGVDMNTGTTNLVPVKRLCRMNGTMCEMATEIGYCRLTACVKKSYEINYRKDGSEEVFHQSTDGNGTKDGADDA